MQRGRGTDVTNRVGGDGGSFRLVLVMQRYRTDDDLKCSRVWNSDSSTAQYLYCNQRVKGILGGFQPHNAPVNST